MKYKKHGNTGKEVSIVGFGGMRFKDIDNRDECVETMVEAAKLGINYFDTAPAYFGIKSEQVFGHAFQEFKRMNIPFYSSSKTFSSKPKDIRKEIEAQLKRLNIDTLDFYHVWNVVTLESWEQRKKNGVIETFIKLKEEGLINHICVSHHLIGDQIRELIKEKVFEAVLFGYSAYNFNARQEGFDIIKNNKLGAVVMNPLGGGVIPQNPDKFDFIKQYENQSVVEAALHFLFAHEEISTALVGFSTKEEVREAVQAVENYKGLSQEKLEKIKSSTGSDFDGLCTGCQYCDSCPEDIPIPKFMDSYNHKIMYDSEKQLDDRLKWHWNLPRDLAARCTACVQCEELCTQHLPIIERLADIAQ
jgi:uncharacterized protein